MTFSGEKLEHRFGLSGCREPPVHQAVFILDVNVLYEDSEETLMQLRNTKVFYKKSWRLICAYIPLRIFDFPKFLRTTKVLIIISLLLLLLLAFEMLNNF